MKRLKFIWDIFARPIWVFITISWWILTNLPTVISVFEFITKQNFEPYKNVFLNSSFFSFLSLYWIPILVIVYLLAIVESLYKKAIHQIGDTRKANLIIELFPRHKEGYASVNVLNNEYDDLIEPELSYLELFLVKNEDLIPKLTEINGGASNISWWRGGQEKIIRGRKRAVFNLAKQEGLIFYFLFDDGSTPQIEDGLYKVTICIEGRMGTEKKKIEPIKKECYLDFFSKNDKYYIDIRETKTLHVEIQASEKGGSPISFV